METTLLSLSCLETSEGGWLLYLPTPPPLCHRCQASMVVKGQGWERKGYNSQASPGKGTQKDCQWELLAMVPQPGKGRKLRLWIRLEEHLLEEEKVPVERGF